MPCRIAMMSLVLMCASCASPVAEPPALATLDDSQWFLRAWDDGDPAPEEPLVTLTYSEGRFAGRSGCNSYSGAVTAGDLPGEIVVGPIAGTRMACPELQMDVESRYLTNLQAATKYTVTDGNFALTYQDQSGQQRAMLFAPRVESQP
jgi:heat shock protein HslJ